MLAAKMIAPRPLALAFALGLCLAAPAGAQDYPAFPNGDKGADPAVSAEMGGKGFADYAAANGWTTTTDFELIGDPRAEKGGELVRHAVDYPSNFRPIGPQANTSFNYLSRDLMFESLLTLHPNTLEWVPSLATHWKKSDDGMTFWYRLNPNARWADGSPVTTEDVYYTWKLHTDESLGSPSSFVTYGKFKEPERVSKYIIKVQCAEKNWRNFLYFNGMHVFPAKQVKPYCEPEPRASDWVKDFNTKFMMPSGPYEMREEDQETGKRVSLRRRKDYWGWDCRANVGRFNFDRISRVVISEQAAAFERLKKGAESDINVLLCTTAKRWVLEMNAKEIEAMRNGALVKRKIFNRQPQGVFGLAMNMNVAPLDKVEVRKALSLLMPRERMIEELMYKQYLPTRSYWPGTIYENEANPKNDYDPTAALELLAAAGYKERNAQGQLLGPDGKPLVVKLTYSSAGIEKHFTMYQQACSKAGVTILLDLTRPEQLWTRVQEKNYEMASMAWGALLFPNPETSYASKDAKTKNNNNITGVADPRIDALIAEYDGYEIEDREKRTACIKKIDGILAQEVYPYVLLWYGPYERFLFWNYFGMPMNGLSCTGDDRDVEQFWWFDAKKYEEVQKARKDPKVLVESPNGERKISVTGWLKAKAVEK